jgi:aconitate hydratase 2/2-methylisocitrate dehydratase
VNWVGLISKAKATELLGTMVGGYNVHPLIELLDDADVADVAAAALKKTLLMFDFFNDVADKAKAGNAMAKDVMQSWADAEWFTTRPEVPKTITVSVFKVPGETNTDDLSPAPDAWSRPDIPLHYLAMLKNTRPKARPSSPKKTASAARCSSSRT